MYKILNRLLRKQISTKIPGIQTENRYIMMGFSSRGQNEPWHLHEIVYPPKKTFGFQGKTNCP